VIRSRAYNVRRRIQATLVAAISLLAAARIARAHDIPSDVTVQMLIRPEGQRLQLLLRVPLAAMRDVDFPATPQGYLDIDRLAPQLPGVATVWLSDFLQVEENGDRLPRGHVAATRISLPSDRSFTSFPAAMQLISGPPLPDSANVFWNQVNFDVLLKFPIRSARSAFSIDPRFQHLGARVLTVVRFTSGSGIERDYELDGNPGLVPLDPGWFQAASRFVRLGFLHILDGTDHLLFLFCLVIPLRRFRPLLAVVTAFTAAHSITLIGSAFGLAPDALWFPPLIETLIAASIVWMALENIVAAKVRHRWMIAFGFGLVHGFGFSFALRRTLQFAGSHLLLSLVSFNLGVELGQLVVLALLIPGLYLLFRFVVEPRMGTIILSAFIAHTGWHWMVDRTAELRRFHFEWPTINIALLAVAMKWLTIAWVAGGVVWLLLRYLRPRESAGRSGTARSAS
jgi:hypothetical protein